VTRLRYRLGRLLDRWSRTRSPVERAVLERAIALTTRVLLRLEPPLAPTARVDRRR
jgi:hypothetical protein